MHADAISSRTAAKAYRQCWIAISGSGEHRHCRGAHACMRRPHGTVPSSAGGRAVIGRTAVHTNCKFEYAARAAQSPELYAGELTAGQRANITASAAGETVLYSARSTAISPAAVRTISLTGRSGEATVEALLPLRGNHRRTAARLFRVRLKYLQTIRHAVVVPYEAVCQRGEQEYVFCVQDGRAVQNAVHDRISARGSTRKSLDGLAAG